MMTLEDYFHSEGYLAHNRARFEHFKTLGLSVSGKTVLEVGAGIGDFTERLAAEGAFVHVTDGRRENVEHMRNRFMGRPEVLTVTNVDLDRSPGSLMGGSDWTKRDLSPAALTRSGDFSYSGQVGPYKPWDVGWCYGVLYHLREPERILHELASNTEWSIFETCVNDDVDATITGVSEDRPDDPTASIRGIGCRPSRRYVWEYLKRFSHVYVPRTQPDHIEFPKIWPPPPSNGLHRAIFVTSREPLRLPTLTDELINQYN